MILVYNFDISVIDNFKTDDLLRISYREDRQGLTLYRLQQNNDYNK